MFSYKLKGHILEREASTKYLGVTLRTDMDWGEHVSNVSKKGNNMLGVLRRNLRTANQTTKTNAYKALVRPHVEYCCSVWNPHKGVDENKIEMIQRRAARYVTNRYHNTSSVTEMLDDLGWETLKTRRVKAQLTMFYKIDNNLVDININDFATLSRIATRANHQRKYKHLPTCRNYFKFSFFPRTIPAWNSLSASVAEAPSLVSFKQGLSSFSC